MPCLWQCVCCHFGIVIVSGSNGSILGDAVSFSSFILENIENREALYILENLLWAST